MQQELDPSVLPELADPSSQQEAVPASASPAAPSSFLDGSMDNLEALGQLITGLQAVIAGQAGGGGQAVPRASGTVLAFSIQGENSPEQQPAPPLASTQPGTLLPELTGPDTSAEQQQILQQIVDSVTSLLGDPPVPDPQRVAALGA